MGAARNGSEWHPFHLHGAHFWALAIANGTWDAATSPASYNLQTPAYRDTVIMPAAGWVALRFRVCGCFGRSQAKCCSHVCIH